ncbi:MAG TPA: SDR family oxidoreductase [Acidimicrobiales bacterium]|nr:SDR family oxidoreductase [Acidimicrobiales bacterium]
MATGSVLVTGASTGIGRACALHVDGLGYRVFAGVRTEPAAESLRRAGSNRLVPVLLDVTDTAAIERAVGSIDSALDGRGLLGVVNNAGVAHGGPIEYLPMEEWRTQLEVNVIGQVAVTRAMMPLVRRGRGRIVFIGSVGGRVGTPLLSPYAASKFAIEGIAESLRHELRPFGVRVVVVEPGAVKTEIWDKGRRYADEMEQRLPAEATALYSDAITGLRRSIDQQDRAGIPPEQVARVVARALFSDRPRARYLVGRDAQMAGLVARILPDSAKDAVVRMVGGLQPR